MIIGIGNDLIDINRVQNALVRFPTRFPSKVLSPFENQAMPNKQASHYIAGRWAAKEAIGKALGTGMRAPCTWQNITVKNNAMGKPYFIFASSITTLLEKKGIRHCHLSISHDVSYALATVILEQ